MIVDHVKVLPHQYKILASRAPVIMAPAGLGSGKTRGVVLASLAWGEEDPHAPTMVCEPTIPMLRDVLVREYREVFAELGIPESHSHRTHAAPCYVYKSQTKDLTVHLGDGCSFDLMLRSTHDPSKLVGGNLGRVILDEAGYMEAEVFEKTIPRVRHPKSTRRVFMATGSPEGHNAYYRYTETHPLEGTEVIRACTYDNVFLKPSPDEYIRERLGHFGEAEQRAYVWGQFVTRGGLVYDNFAPARHHRDTHKGILTGELVLCVDFGNVTSFAGLAAIYVEDGQERLHVFDEVLCRRQGTHRLAEAVRKKWLASWSELSSDRWIKWEDIAERLTAYTDSSPWQRAERTLLEGSLGIQVRKRKRNPFIMDRVYSVNQMLGQGRLTIDPARCEYLARCLSQQGYANDGFPEKSSDDGNGPPGLDHGVDALGYLAVQRWPVLAPRGNVREASYH